MPKLKTPIRYTSREFGSIKEDLVRYAKTERDVLSYTVHNFIVSLNFAF